MMQHDLVKALWKDLSFHGIYPDIFNNNPPPQKKPRRKIKKSISQTLGELDSVFQLMQKLKPIKSDYAYLARKHGAVVINSIDPEADVHSGKITTHKAYGFPGILTAFHSGDEDRDCISYFIVMTKKKEFPSVVYSGVFVTNVNGNHVETDISVSVDRDTGSVKALPVIYYQPVFIPQGCIRKSKKGRGSGHFYTSQKMVSKLGMPDLRQEGLESSNSSKEEAIESYFCTLFNVAMARESATNIVAESKHGKAIFFLNGIEEKEFFKDRVPVIQNERSKKIYHAVKSHYRSINGENTTVKTHYRGARDFEWGGYSISIKMPGLHVKQNAAFGLSFISHKPKGEKVVGPKKLLNFLSAAGL